MNLTHPYIVDAQLVGMFTWKSFCTFIQYHQCFYFL